MEDIKKAGVPAIVSSLPQKAERYGKIAEEAGVDCFIVQSTVTTVRHIAKAYQVTDFTKLCAQMKVPVILGNCVTYKVALELMETGCAGLLVGIGPGSACFTPGGFCLRVGPPEGIFGLFFFCVC